jgi:hypothetical protein
MYIKRTVSVTLGFVFIGLILLNSIMNVVNDLEELRWHQTNNPTTPRIVGGQKTTTEKIKEAKTWF